MLTPPIKATTADQRSDISKNHSASNVRSELTALPILYSAAMVAESECFSPSAAKPRAVIESWNALGVPMTIREPRAISVQNLASVHDSSYVNDVIDCRRSNGFGNRSAAVAQSLFYTNGAMLGAAREALSNGRVAIAPCSGFHHAAFDHGGGFCTFNGLMVAAKVLLDEGKVSRVGILDFDQHWGDGTHNIIHRLRLKSAIRHYHPSGNNAERFIGEIPSIINKFADCDLVLYQAGADPHIDDPLGGWLTTAQIKERDRSVFRECSRLEIPVAWNLAGGYQRDEQDSIRPVLDIHDNTLLVCAEAYLNADDKVAMTSNRKELAPCGS